MKKIVIGVLFLSIFGPYGSTFAVSISSRTEQVANDLGEAADAVDGLLGTFNDAKKAVEGIFSGTAEETPSIISNGSGPIFSGKGLSGGAKIVEKELSGSVSKEHDIKALIISWTNFLLPIAVSLAVLAIVWAGFLYITALGDDGNMDKAKNIIIWVVVGLLVIAAAYAIVNFVMTATF